MLLRKIKNIKNYFSSKEKAKKSPGNIRRDTKSGQLIENVIYEHSIRKNNSGLPRISLVFKRRI